MNSHFRLKPCPPGPEQCLAFYPFDTEAVEYPNNGLQVKHLPIVMYGQFSQVNNRTIGRNFLVLQIVFTPGALYRLTGIPSHELCNCYVDGEMFFSLQIRFVNEQLAAAPSYVVMLEIGTNFVRSLMKQQKKNKLLIDDACLQLLHNSGLLTVKDIAREACLSTKQLERRFKERLGVHPKL